MAVSMKEVRAALDPDELDYHAAARELGAGAIPHLQTLINGDDPMLASKAVYLASLIPHEGVRQLLHEAAGQDDPIVRTAAAAAARNLEPQAASDVLVQLVTDADPGVRKVARAAVPEQPSDSL